MPFSLFCGNKMVISGNKNTLIATLKRLIYRYLSRSVVIVVLNSEKLYGSSQILVQSPNFYMKEQYF